MTGKKTLISNYRSCGVLLAVSSLPSPYGIGSFGGEAFRWYNFLKAAGQRYWQILPLHPAGWGDSPYQSCSAFAINPYFIDFEKLYEDGLLQPRDYQQYDWGAQAAQVDYAALWRHKKNCLKKAFAKFKPNSGYKQFCAENTDWLAEYALFMAIKDEFGGGSFLRWPAEYKHRDKNALARFKRLHKDSIAYYFFEQYIAFIQWRVVKVCANCAGIKIIGDMPIYVSMDSADLWAQPGLFQVDEALRPLFAAGCPPDPFSRKGQIWGNPLYRWDRMEEDSFAWWKRRLERAFELYDAVRIDHFRGLEQYYAIPPTTKSARKGHWEKGPGQAFISMIHENFPGKSVIAEDLGRQTPELKELLASSGFPGTKVVQFAFDSREAGDYMPYTYTRDSVVYTGTHDNATAASWPALAADADRLLAKEALSVQAERDWAPAFVKAALMSASDTAIIPMQDYLGLGAGARMNTPGEEKGNWRWRLKSGALTERLADRMLRLARISGRLP